MRPRRDGQQTSRRTSRKLKLARLDASASAGVLGELLRRHPKLRGEAEEIASAPLQAVEDEDFRSVAEAVEADVHGLNVEEVYESSGASRWGYTDPGDAAGDMIEEVLEPFLDFLRDLLDIGSKRAVNAALEHCKGIVLGLYRAAHGRPRERWDRERTAVEGRVLDWAPDVPQNLALEAVEVWRSHGRRGRKPLRPWLPEAFVRQHTPKWAGLGGRRSGLARANSPT